MALNAAALEAMGNGLAGVAVAAAIHDGPLSTDEISSARQAITLTATGGNITLSAPENFTGPASAPVTEVGLWSQVAAGGTFYGTVEITTGDLAFNAAGEYTLDDLDLTGSAT